MASGANVVKIHKVMFPNANAAAPGMVLGGSTPAERIPVWLFDPSTIEYLDFLCELNGYGGGGITWTYLWSSGATSGACRWSGAFRRLQDDAEDVDTSQTYDYNDVDATTASVSREQDYATLTFTDGADMDSVANNEFFIYRVRRNASHANDTLNSNDAELWTITGKET